jgi:hypothetical protein
MRADPLCRISFLKSSFLVQQWFLLRDPGAGRATKPKGLAGNGAAIELHIQRHEPQVAPTNRLTTIA